jgi:hypothetical protein
MSKCNLREPDLPDAMLCQVIANVVAVVAFVAEKLGGTCVVKLHQRIEALRLVNLATGKIERQWVAFTVRRWILVEKPPRERGRALAFLDSPFTPAAC